MPLYAQVGNGALATVGNTTLTTAQQAKLLLLLGNIQTAVGIAADATLCTGGGDGTTGFSTSAHETDGVSTGVASLFAGFGAETLPGDSYEETQTTNAGIDWEYEATTLGATSFTLTQLQAPLQASLLDFMALGGSNFVNWKIGNFALNTATGHQAITGVGFKPSMVLFFWGSWQTTVGSNNMCSLGYGAADGTSQWALGTAGQGPANSTNKTLQRIDRCILSGNLTGLDSDADLFSMDADGFTINVDTGSSSRSILVGYIAFAGPLFKVGSFAKSTAAAPVTDAVNVGFAPSAVFLASHGTAANNAVQADTTLSYGYADGTNHTNVWIGMKDASATAGAHARHVITKAITIALATATGTTPTVLAEADVNFSGTNVNVHWTTNDSNADQILYWAIGASDTLIGPGGFSLLPLKLGSPTPAAGGSVATGLYYYRRRRRQEKPTE